mmetsp:Transcript_636/g.2306  ORF Transcript_636/g.2306 Transcript_636/m.2306 type:complete len:208 (+) Transcript_636:1828-2451(+)
MERWHVASQGVDHRRVLVRAVVNVDKVVAALKVESVDVQRRHASIAAAALDEPCATHRVFVPLALGRSVGKRPRGALENRERLALLYRAIAAAGGFLSARQRCFGRRPRGFEARFLNARIGHHHDPQSRTRTHDGPLSTRLPHPARQGAEQWRGLLAPVKNLDYVVRVFHVEAIERNFEAAPIGFSILREAHAPLARAVRAVRAFRG